jgi:tetratricopeptide (TPR) repeat protein
MKKCFWFFRFNFSVTVCNTIKDTVVRSLPSDQEKSLFSDYERTKLAIRTGELFAAKLKSSKIRTSERKKVLSELYYYLGSRYVASNQPERALDSFQKSFDLQRSNYSVLYGIAYCYREIEPEKSKTLFHQFLEMAPSCDKQTKNVSLTRQHSMQHTPN